MALPVSLTAEVASRGHDATQHNLYTFSTALFSLTSDTSAYTTDMAAFATSVYTYYNTQVGTSGIDNVEIRYFVNVNSGNAEDSGVVNVNITSATDVQNALDAVVVNAGHRVQGSGL